MKSLTLFTILFLGFMTAAGARAGEGPDELYRKGRYAEAEKAYARGDMDHPRDVRYRYNRGCAAYRQGDYKGAAAAFASVLRRSEDPALRFRAAYNAGNAAFKQGDFASASSYFQKALENDPGNGDARNNLELALRALEKAKKEKDQKGSQKPGEGRKKDKQKKDGSGRENKEQKESSDKTADRGETPEQQKPGSEHKTGQKEKEKGQGESRQAPEKGREPSGEKNLAGELKPLEEPGGQETEEKSRGAEGAGIDRKRAEALLDNMKEDRSRFLRFQVPPDKRGGVSSGKDW